MRGKPFIRNGCVCGLMECAIPFGLCHCGCGQPTAPARQSDRSRNWVRGLPVRYLTGHAGVGQTHTTKPREKPRFEVYEGEACVWIQRSDGSWTLVDEDCIEIALLHPWYNSNGYSVWEDRDGNSVFLQNLIMPTAEGMIADHKNRHRWDNRRSNLRPASKNQNQWNRKVQKNNTTGYPGIKQLKSGNWQVRMNYKGKTIHLGSFESKDDAIRAKKDAEIRLYGEFRGESPQCQS